MLPAIVKRRIACEAEVPDVIVKTSDWWSMARLVGLAASFHAPYGRPDWGIFRM